MGDELNLPMAYLSEDKREHERESMFSQSESNSRMPDQEPVCMFPVSGLAGLARSQFYMKTWSQLAEIISCLLHSSL